MIEKRRSGLGLKTNQTQYVRQANKSVVLTFGDLVRGPDLDLGNLLLDLLGCKFIDLREIAFIAIVSFEDGALQAV